MRRLLLAGLAAAVLSAPAALGSDAQSRMTIFVRPTVIGWAESALLYGTAPGASHADVVTIQVRECGSAAFRTFVELHPSSGGGWSTPAGAAVTAAYRATFRGRTSATVTVRQRADVRLERRRSGSGFLVSVIARRSFWRKQVVIQRRQGGRWQDLRRVVLTDSVSSTGTVSASQATVRLAVPRGTVLRAFLPETQARPCYAASTSRAVRT
jgi:hypothetical protein